SVALRRVIPRYPSRSPHARPHRVSRIPHPVSRISYPVSRIPHLASRISHHPPAQESPASEAKHGSCPLRRLPHEDARMDPACLEYCLTEDERRTFNDTGLLMLEDALSPQHVQAL